MKTTLIKKYIHATLPPMINFNTQTGRFYGKSKPNETVKITSNTDYIEKNTIADKEGNWEIPLIRPPRLYTIFHIWTCDTATEKTSDRIRFTYGGAQPKLEDVYASEASVFGVSRPGTEITAYSQRGEVLGRSFAFGKQGAWLIKFPGKVTTGEQICIVAKLINGNQSMPFYTRVNAFSISECSVGRIAGSGAEGHARIHLFDAIDNCPITETVATERGLWSFSFRKALKEGARIKISSVEANDVSAEGPTLTTMNDGCLIPQIDGLRGSLLWGTATPGYLVQVERYNNGQLQTTYDPVQALTDASWQLTLPAAAQSGDVFTAQTSTANRASTFYNAVSFEKGRPMPPLIEEINGTNAKGLASPNQFVIVSTASHGELMGVMCDENGNWQTPYSWKDFGIDDPAAELFAFEDAQTITPAATNSTSNYSARYGSTTGVVPVSPLITQCDGYVFSGEEITMPTNVSIYDLNDSGNSITITPMPVHHNRWTSDDVILYNSDSHPPVPFGDKIYAIATYMLGGNPLSTSIPSSPYCFVGTPPQIIRPLPPEIFQIQGGGVVQGQSEGNTTVILQMFDQQQKVYENCMYTDTGEFSFRIDDYSDDGFPSSSRFFARSYFSNGACSEVFVKAADDDVNESPAIEKVEETCITLVPQDCIRFIVGFRKSDGKGILNYEPYISQKNITEPATVPYLEDEKLEAGDEIFVTAVRYKDNSMSAYNHQPEGYTQ